MATCKVKSQFHSDTECKHSDCATHWNSLEVDHLSGVGVSNGSRRLLKQVPERRKGDPVHLLPVGSPQHFTQHHSHRVPGEGGGGGGGGEGGRDIDVIIHIPSVGLILIRGCTH